MDNALLSLQGITKVFPGVRALSEVALELYSGEVTALVGENGAGKSTLVKVLTGIHPPDGGQILLDGEPVKFAALSQQEIEELYTLVETLKRDGKAILFISHKFDEIFRIADRYTVFRDGR